MNENDTPVHCVCGSDTLFVWYREGLGVYAQCVDCRHYFRVLTGADNEAPVETGRCINCGCYFDVVLGAAHDVCSDVCGNALAAEFNRMIP